MKAPLCDVHEELKVLGVLLGTPCWPPAFCFGAGVPMLALELRNLCPTLSRSCRNPAKIGGGDGGRRFDLDTGEGAGAPLDDDIDLGTVHVEGGTLAENSKGNVIYERP